MTRAARVIDREPFLVASVAGSTGRLLHKGLAAVCRAPYVVTKK